MTKEFRGVWIATVGNLDWPSQAGLLLEKQQSELLSFFDLFAGLGLNAVIFQVRPCCDAFYDSAFEPWSEFLAGTQGVAPGYDPLRFAIDGAHARGLELHAWLNPFRARYSKRLSVAAAGHISVARPGLVKDYGTMQWLDPALDETQNIALEVTRDILRHYEVDGVHIDDYFYPYKVAGQEFPDNASWALYKGALSRDDWRRGNVNRFVEALHGVVKEEKPAARLGISPFGIWRPGNPPGIKGLDAFAELYADARLWLQQGWLDYFAPQLYWPIDSPGQSFPKLLDWWKEQNVKNLPIYPGLYTARTADKTPWPVEEIVKQIELTRGGGLVEAPGHIHFSARCLRSANLQAALKGVYA